MTQPVRRYEHPERVENHPEWHECDVGHYVTYTDYLALEADLLRANSNNTALYSSLERVIAERDAAIAERNRARADEELADSRWMQDGEKREKAEAERDALMADARRYRWLRERSPIDAITVESYAGTVIKRRQVYFLGLEELDAAIDSALATQEAG